MAKKDKWIDISKRCEVRNTKEYKNWVKNVKERDNKKCVLCRKTSIMTQRAFSFKNFLPLRLTVARHNLMSRTS